MPAKGTKCCCCECAVTTDCCSCACEALCAKIDNGTPAELCSNELKWDGTAWQGTLGCVDGSVTIRVTHEQITNEEDVVECWMMVESAALGLVNNGPEDDTRQKYKIPDDVNCRRPSVSFSSSLGTVTIECAERVELKHCDCSCKCECLCVSITKQRLGVSELFINGVGTACWDPATKCYTGTVTYDDEAETTEEVSFCVERLEDHPEVGTTPEDACVIGFNGEFQLMTCTAEEVNYRWEILNEDETELKQVNVTCLPCEQECKPVVHVPCCLDPLPSTLFATVESLAASCACAGGSITLNYAGLAANGDGNYRIRWTGTGNFGCPRDVEITLYCLMIPTVALPFATGGFFLDWNEGVSTPDTEDCSEESFEFTFSGTNPNTSPNWCGEFEPDVIEGGAWKVTITA